jgi:hypothetical protein
LIIEAKIMTEAKVRRMHNPVYNSEEFPPLPPRIRLAANCWERVWWVSFVDPMTQVERLAPIASRFSSETVTIRAQMRTQRRVCFAITTNGLDEQSEFEVAMMVIAKVHQEIGHIERVEDRPSSMWPIEEF